MSDVTNEANGEPDVTEPIATDVVPTPIRTGPTGIASPPRAAPEGEAGCPRPFLNERLNSRLTASLPEGPWEVRWRTELTELTEPHFVLQVNDRIVIQGEYEWQLFDMKGDLLTAERLGYSGVVLDGKNGLFYAADVNGFLAARELADGRVRFLLSAYYADQFRRVLFARRGDEFLIASVERRLDPHGAHPPRQSVLEVLRLGDPMEATEDGVVTSGGRPSELMVQTPKVLAALHDRTLVLATAGRVYLLDWDLKVRTLLTDDFEPLAMSLDEAGRMYLIVRTPTDHALWVVTQEGERVMTYHGLPAVEHDAYAPPVVDCDHRVYVIGGELLTAIDPDGRAAWQRRMTGVVAGAVVTAAGQLLVSEGAVLGAYDGRGEQRVLYAVPGDTLRTPPALTEQGALLVASSKYLYCLEPRNSQRR